MRALAIAAVAVIVAAACQSGSHDRGAPAATAAGSDAGPAAKIDAAACEAAIAAAAKAPPLDRARVLLAGCRPCDDAALLDWNRLQTAGGPTRLAIMTSLDSCHAYCSNDAHQRFLDALDRARGGPSLKPWRELAKTCAADAGFGGDAARFPTATMFALQRISRELRAHGGAAATALQTLELPLPAWSTVGAGLTLPELAAGASASAITAPPRRVLTLTADHTSLGELPTLRFDATGAVVDWHGAPYPGAAIDGEHLRGALAVGDTVIIIAPAQLPASRLHDVIGHVSAGTLVLAVAARRGDWPLVGALPVALTADDRAAPPIHITADMTVNDVAAQLAQLAGSGIDRASLIP